MTYERSYDTFHSNYENLFRIKYKVYRSGELNIDCAAAVPRVGPFMKENMPEVQEYARVYPENGVISYGDKKFFERRIQVVDPSFLQIFDFPLIEGDKETVLLEPYKVVMSEDAVRKYFGDEDPIGKIIKIDGEHSLSVTGVAQNVPNNSHLKFDFLVSFATLNSQTQNDDGVSASETSWGWYDYNSYVLLEPGVDIADYDSRFEEILYAERGEDFEKFDFKAEFPLQPVGDIHLYSNLLQESEPEEQGDGQAVFFLTIVAFFILLIAWINYINLSTARSVERAKEVGIRKTMGAYRKQLINQFLAESFVLNFLALILGLLIVTIGINYFNQLTDSSLSLSFLTDGLFWGVVGAIYFVGSVFSGVYPAFILSSFKPVAVLKGKLSSNKSGALLRKSLVVFQFASSITLIAGTIIVYQQLKHMTSLDLGFDMTETLVIKGPGIVPVDSLYQSTYETFKTEIIRNSGIKTIASSSNVPGMEIFWTNGIKRDEEARDKFKIIYIASIDYDYIPSYDIDLLTGRNYSKDFPTDTGAIILNKAAIDFLGFSSVEEALNEKVTFWGQPKTIVGIVDNYKQMSVKNDVAPIAFPLQSWRGSYFTLNLETSDYQDAFDDAQAKYQRAFPGNPFDYFFLDEHFNRQYKNERKFSRVFTLFAGFAILVACLGLFGLSSFSALQKTKEIGIRKAIGADVSNIVVLLSREFMILVLVANLIAWPVIYLVMDAWLNNFAERIAFQIPVFLVSGILVVLIAFLTVAYKTIVTARSNPVTALRYE